MKIAIMQPYLFPYIGYFQLINAVDVFVFYDDVNFIKGGWINRNQILINGKASYINLLMSGASSNKLINEVFLNTKTVKKIHKTVSQSYSKAPYFDSVFPIIEKYLSLIENNMPISEASALSVKLISQYLELSIDFKYSSKSFSETKGLERKDRLIKIVHNAGADKYINSIGGKELYDKNSFAQEGISLYFLKSKTTEYEQFELNFLPNLSIIDVIMFNSILEVREMLHNYELE
jgi:hypothetical protein